MNVGRGGQLYRVGDRLLTVSRLDKVLYPETGTTKAEILHYYLTVADAMIPLMHGRPVTRKRWVDGVGTANSPGEVFFRKDLEDSAPGWIPTGRQTHSTGVSTYPLAQEAAVLAWFAQVAALELHVPQWRFGRQGQPRHPDRLVLDLDPGEGMGLQDCAAVAGLCRDILDDMGMSTFPVTSGSTGIHLYAPLDGTHNSDVISAFARELARGLEADHPDLVVSTMTKSRRRGRVLVDWSQNNSSKTTIIPYSLRGRLRPTVAAPRTWEEITAPGLRHLEMGEVLERLERGLNPIAALGDEDVSIDRLSTYRSMRDPGRTTEPVPAQSPSQGSEGHRPIFVIHEHHASSLHWDFRLEHFGVLVSWAIPKGPPAEHGTNRLAIKTEDHPIEYASVEGVIPRGEYGAGTVSIWDSGFFECEKWVDGSEVIAVLHGEKAGGLGGIPRRFALVTTASMGKDAWLLRLPDAQPEGAPTLPRTVPTINDLPSPMLARPAVRGDVAEGSWAYEMKWDGYRLVAGIVTDGTNGAVVLSSRNGVDMTDRVPELSELVHLLTGDALAAGGAILDGELVTVDEQGRPDFGKLQAALRGDEEADLRYMVFDILHLGPPSAGRSLIRRPFLERRSILEAGVAAGEHVAIPPHDLGDLATAEKASRELGLEGVVAKRIDSVYLPGERGTAWLKLKFHPHQSIVVIGVRRGRDGRGIRSLLAAVPDDQGELRYAGRVGSGFSQSQLVAIDQELRRLERKTPPVADVPEADMLDAWWVTPKKVGEVTVAGRTRNGRLRHAVWRGWRTDLAPADVRWEV